MKNDAIINEAPKKQIIQDDQRLHVEDIAPLPLEVEQQRLEDFTPIND